MTAVQLRLPDNLSQQFDALAAQAGHSREPMIIEAMKSCLMQSAEEDAAVALGIAEADRGEVVEATVVSAENEASLRARV